MNNKKKLVLSFSILLCFVALGCVSQKNIYYYNISRPNDDGNAYVDASTLPEAMGGLQSGIGGINIGYLASENQIYRAFYRFNISSWQGNDLEFQLKCSLKTGDPGTLAFYVIDDFGSLSSIEDSDVSFYWNFAGEGVLAEEVSPQEGWFEVNIPGNIVGSKKTDAGYISIMAKLSNEDRRINGVYNLLSYEQANYLGTKAPYLVEEY